MLAAHAIATVQELLYNAQHNNIFKIEQIINYVYTQINYKKWIKMLHSCTDQIPMRAIPYYTKIFNNVHCIQLFYQYIQVDVLMYLLCRPDF